MCRDCIRQKVCHETCEYCDEYYEQQEKDDTLEAFNKIVELIPNKYAFKKEIEKVRDAIK